MTASVPAPHSRPRDVVGIVGLVLAIVLVLAQIGRTALTTAIPVLAFRGGFDTTQIGALFAALGVTMLVLATATAIVGVIGVARKDRARLLSAVTLGVGASVAIVELGALVVPPLVGLSLQY
ncbi:MULTISPECIES: hypothetical protein [unclassified Rathayibacter]|uniref:hypothetical protein n=1 Tax=unclassified Rathayibacter TaxID=2609250 RepID=UPI000CE8CF1F|nr:MULTISPECIES: hypothetical protein [unclassified Rathayibacter]PPF16203.1 hypothetical protein C5B92_12500 [Rathayibacter sp. AY1A4]PPG77954.1 hypothetical protein C5C52_13795 [Rathayibacter sp. AY1E5]PPH28121.1 hypothetical protein C5C94_14085 [Rathayibacter sp. AY1C3]PPH63995.1 hypothetical protein C5D25_06230 [Rathayibacter sp. AY1D7]PPI29910.1 hypothetical protein C5D66_09900 [Rathayibacter sp. AY1B4]